MSRIAGNSLRYFISGKRHILLFKEVGQVTKVFDKNDTFNSMILTDYSDLLSVDDLSTIFGVSKQTIRRELKHGKFGDVIQIGRAFKIPKISVIQRFFNV